MKKKFLAAALAAVMSFGVLAGCGGSDTASGSADGNAAAEETAGAAEDNAAADGASYQIGVIQLIQHPALDAATEGFQDALKEKLGDSVSFDVQNASGDSATCATIANTFVNGGYDLILANATASLQAASAATADIPIVGTSITDYATALSISDWTGTTGINVTGTCDLAPLDRQADMTKEIFPDAENIGIIYCSAEPNSKYQADMITGYLTDLGYNVKSYTFADSNDIAQVTQNACDASDVLYIPTDNTAANCTELINNVALPAGVPIVAGEEGICQGCGAVTLSISYYDIGYAAGEMAYQILAEGKDPASMDIQTASAVTKKYNAAICEELGIEVPSDYEAVETE